METLPEILCEWNFHSDSNDYTSSNVFNQQNMPSRSKTTDAILYQTVVQPQCYVHDKMVDHSNRISSMANSNYRVFWDCLFLVVVVELVPNYARKIMWFGLFASWEGIWRERLSTERTNMNLESEEKCILWNCTYLLRWLRQPRCFTSIILVNAKWSSRHIGRSQCYALFHWSNFGIWLF